MAPLILLLGLATVLHLTFRLIYTRILYPPFHNIAGPPAGGFMLGNLKQLVGHDAWGYIQDLVDTFGPVSRLHGFLNVPMLHVYDPKALHSILVKDNDSFYRGRIINSFSMLVFGPGLLATSGAAHKKQRKMLNPVFSGAHMRNLTPIFHEVSRKLKLAIETRVKDGPATLDIVGWMGRTALELVGQGGLGHSFDPLIEDTQDEYTEAVKGFSATNSDLRHLRGFLPYLVRLGPAWFRRMLLDLIPYEKVQRIKRSCDIVNRGCLDLFNAKKEALKGGDETLLQLVGEGKDVMSVLLRENMRAVEEEKLPDEQLLAQIVTFIVAGTDTTSNALARTLHILSNEREVQDKLRKEILEAHAKHGPMISYDDLNRLSYLDAVCRETLRLHAPVSLSQREACADTVLPLSEPVRGKDGSTITEIPIPKGTTVVLNLRACNTNKALWGEDAHEWKPERWLQPLPRALEDARIPGIYANLMTFLAGGFACIGFKFSQLEMKVVLYMLLASFTFERCEKPIVWNFAGIAYPALSKESSKPEMYLKVGLVSG